eukprot:COSAG02_NODE_424_length_22575_cov_79.088361_19_plen_1122_part_00
MAFGAAGDLAEQLLRPRACSLLGLGLASGCYALHYSSCCWYPVRSAGRHRHQVAWRKKQQVCEALRRAADQATTEAAEGSADECTTRATGPVAHEREGGWELPQRGREEVPGGTPMAEAARPLFRAALCGDAEAVCALLAAGADLHARTSLGRSILAVLSHTRGIDQTAVPMLRRAGLIDQDGNSAATSPGTASYAANRWRCAFELYDLVLCVSPSALFALAGRQRAAAALGSHVTALLDATEVLARRPDDGALWLAKATAYEALEMFQHAYDAAAEGLRSTHHIRLGNGVDVSGNDTSGAVDSDLIGCDDRRSLTEFLRRPWIHDFARADGLEAPVSGTSAAARKLQRAFRRLRDRQFDARLRRHMATIVAAVGSGVGEEAARVTGAAVPAELLEKNNTAAGAALAALGMCDVPSAAAYVAAVLEAPPLDGRGTLREIVQQLYRRAGPAAACTLLGVSDVIIPGNAVATPLQAAVVAVLESTPALFERCDHTVRHSNGAGDESDDEWLLAGFSPVPLLTDVVHAFNTIDLHQPVHGAAPHVAQRKALKPSATSSPWSEGWADAWQEEAGMSTHRRAVRRCKLLHIRHTDDDFPPHNLASIEETPGTLDVELVKSVAPQWRRLYDIALEAPADAGSSSVGPCLFEANVDASEVVQGALGDCWLAAALSIVTQQPLLLHALFAAADIRAGVYTVRLFHEGGWRFIMVDDYVPVSIKDGRPVFAHAKSRQELWVPILEKAFAKLYGSFASIEAGQLTDALVCLTAGLPERILTKPPRSNLKSGKVARIDTNELFRKLVQLSSSNADDGRSDSKRWGALSHYLLGAGSIAGDDHSRPRFMHGIVPGHAYALLGTYDLNSNSGSKEVDPSLQLLQLRNPWGQPPARSTGFGTWTGAWSDGAPEWSLVPHARAVTGYDQKHAWSFFISMLDFVKLFSCVYVCNVLPSDWHTNVLHSAWDDGTGDGVGVDQSTVRQVSRRSSSGVFRQVLGGSRTGTAGGCSKHKSTYLNNPQFVLSATRQRSSLSSEPLASRGQHAEDPEDPITVHLVLSQADPRRSHLRPCVAALYAFVHVCPYLCACCAANFYTEQHHMFAAHSLTCFGSDVGGPGITSISEPSETVGNVSVDH